MTSRHPSAFSFHFSSFELSFRMKFALALLFFIVCTFPALAGWQSYECQLAIDKYHDGDSFSGKAQTGYTYVWRLYGVDCPEADERQPERLEEQAKHFGVDTKTVLKWGREAADFTAKTLSRGYTAHTQKHDARGASRKNRYYAVILVKNQDLAELLVLEGLARAFGMSVAFPPDKNVDEERFMRNLRNLENRAKSAKKGIWSESK